MPYRNIVFVKLEKRLLNDPRWWTMSSYSQLIYIKLMLLAAETYNKIPLNDTVLIQSIRCAYRLDEFRRCLKEISANFPKFKKNKSFRYFKDFETKTNWVNTKELPRNSRGTPKVVADQDQDQEKDKDQEKEGGVGGVLFTESVERQIKTKLAEKNHHAVDSEANRIAFENLVAGIAKDKTIKNPAKIALFRAGRR